MPYSNTVHARDIRNGSRTVFIAGKEIALSDQSYFHTSTGNEPATSQYQKGIVSQAITGRAYSQSWSPNVKVEGQNGKEDSASKELGDLQDALALTSRCLRARKCSLVPYSSKSHIGSGAQANKVETSSAKMAGAFPLSGCSKKCIEAQLKDYYNKHC